MNCPLFEWLQQIPRLHFYFCSFLCMLVYFIPYYYISPQNFCIVFRIRKLMLHVWSFEFTSLSTLSITLFSALASTEFKIKYKLASMSYGTVCRTGPSYSSDVFRLTNILSHTLQIIPLLLFHVSILNTLRKVHYLLLHHLEYIVMSEYSNERGLLFSSEKLFFRKTLDQT